MAELVDALDSKSSSSNGVWVRFPLRVLKKEISFEISFFMLQILLRIHHGNGRHINNLTL